jgi:pyrimidine operon attenuation protein/uracil phosphoribosyltransferase
MQSRLILNSQTFEITIRRLCYQLIENYNHFENTAIIGLQPRGVYLARRIIKTLNDMLPAVQVMYGELDITFYRDDFRRRTEIAKANATKIDFIIEDRKVVLVDDVLYTGRTIRAGLDALLAFGRPRKVELLTLIDRKFARQLPIAPNYTGHAIDSIDADTVNVQWHETDLNDSVWLHTKTT